MNEYGEKYWNQIQSILHKYLIPRNIDVGDELIHYLGRNLTKSGSVGCM
jgi:hypothetical protein